MPQTEYPLTHDDVRAIVREEITKAGDLVASVPNAHAANLRAPLEVRGTKDSTVKLSFKYASHHPERSDRLSQDCTVGIDDESQVVRVLQHFSLQGANELELCLCEVGEALDLFPHGADQFIRVRTSHNSSPLVGVGASTVGDGPAAGAASVSPAAQARAIVQKLVEAGLIQDGAK